MNRRIALVLFLCSTFVSVFSQSPSASIKGVLRTSDGQPAAEVNVQVKELKRGISSAADGSYIINHIPAGNYTLVVSFVGLQTLQQPVRLQDGETKELDFVLVENENQLAEIVVTARRSMNEKVAGIGKMNIKPMDLPQSISIIGKDILDRQQVLQLSDALQNTTGVYIMGATGGYQEEIAGRGYPFTSSNTFKNGVRFNNAILPELSSVEKIEFLKGGSAILFGNVAAGGVLNIVTKKPKFQSGGEISFRSGSYDFYKPSIDIYGSLDKANSMAYRVNTTYQKAGSFRDRVSSERFYINPSFLAKLGKRTELLVEGDYLKDTRNPDFGIGAINYVIAEVPRDRFLGVSWGYNKATQGSVMTTLTHSFNDDWQLKAAVGMQDYEAELFSAARPTTIQPNGQWARGLQKSRTQENYYIAQVDLTGKIRTGRMEHLILLGADADRYRTKAFAFVNNRYNANNADAAIRNLNIYDTINIYEPSTFDRRQDIPYLATDRITTSPIDRYGIYLQDLVSLTRHLKLLAGIRYSSQRNQRATVDSVAKGTRGYVNAYKSDAFSPRLGLVYQPLKTVSLFASYTNTFNVNTGVDINNEPLKPSIVDQYELGVKTDLLRGLLSANLTLYRIVNSNFAQNVLPPPTNVPGAKELAGEVTSKGMELDIATKPIHGFSLIAGYSYNDTRYTNSNIYKSGERLRYNPAHTANASLFYQFDARTVLHGFSLGVGTYYVGDRLAGRNPSTANPNFKIIGLPDYLLFDASVGYSVQRVSLRVKLTNILNKLSYNVHDDNSVNPIAPRQLAATIAYKL